MKPLLALFLFVACACQAQTSSISLSKKFSMDDPFLPGNEGSTYKVGDNWYTMEVAGKNMQFAFTATLNKLKYRINICKYDADMKEVKKIAFQGKEKEFGPFNPQMIYFHSQLVLLYYKVMEDGSIKLYLSTIDPETLEEKGNKELYTFSERNVGFLKAEKTIMRNQLLVARTPDKTKLFISQSGNTKELFSCFIGDDMTPVQKTITRLKEVGDDLDISRCKVDNAGNKFFAYSYKAGPTQQRGILLQSDKGKDTYLSLPPSVRGEAFDVGPLSFVDNHDHTKMYVYALYGHSDEEEEGLLVTTIDAGNASLAKPQLYPFPVDIKMKLGKRDFAGKKHGSFFMDDRFYGAICMEDGTLVLTGSPIHNVSHNHFVHTLDRPNDNLTSPDLHTFCGPVINAFIKDGKCNFGVLYRNQNLSQASDEIVHPYGDKIVCIYTDSKKNLNTGPSDDLEKTVDDDDLVLIEAVMRNDGSVISRKMIGEGTGKSGYFLSSAHRLSDHSYIFPLGRNRIGMSRFYTQIEQWVTVDIN